MAPFNPGLSPTNDPNYLNSSRGYNKSDVSTDTSLGNLFGNIGSTIGTAVSAIDTTIKSGIRDDLYEKIDAIRDAHGADLTPEETIAIAGKGGRGSKYANAGTTGDLAMENAVPEGVTKKIDGLKRMKAAYDAGLLSNSHYDASLLAAVKEVRSKYPGYREDIDTMVKAITGVDPANELRRNTLTDMVSMAAASQSAASKIETQFLKDREWLLTVDPSINLEKYGANKQSYDVAVGKLMARDQQIKSQELELNLGTKIDEQTTRLATQTFTDRVNQYISNNMAATINQLRIKAEDLQRQGSGASPKEVQEVAAQYQVLRGQLESGINTIARKPLNDRGQSYSTVLKPDVIKGIREQALGDLDPVIKNLGVKETGVAYAAANIIKHSQDQTLLRLSDKYPQTRTLKAIGTQVGDSAMSVIVQQSGILPELSKAIADKGIAAVVDTESGKPPPPVSELLDNHGPYKSAKTSQVTVRQLLEAVKHPDPAVATRAVQSLYGDATFFANVDSADKQRIFTTLARPDVYQKVKQVGGEAFDTYKNWMEQNFVTVFKQGMDDLQSAVTNNKFKWSFNPDTLQFKAETLPQYRMEKNRFTGQMDDPAQAYVAKINQGLRAVAPLMKDVYGADAPTHVAQLVQSAPGINFAAAPKGTVLGEIAGAIGGWFREHVKFQEAPEAIMGVRVDNIPEGMSARDFIRMLQTKEQKKKEAQPQ